MPEEKEFVDDIIARSFWLGTGIFSSYSLGILLSNFLGIPDKNPGLGFLCSMIFFLIGMGMFLLLFFCVSPPDVTYETGPVVRVIFQLALSCGMFIVGYEFPKSENLFLSSALIAGGMAVAQLVYPCRDFHIGFGILAIFGVFSMFLIGTEFDPRSSECIISYIIALILYVYMVLVCIFPKQAAGFKCGD